MKQKLIALLLVSVMVASTLGALSLNATRVGATGESLTLSSTNYAPYAGQQYTLSGVLRDSAGNALANKPVDIFYRLVGGTWHFSNTVYTDGSGRYSTTTSSSQTVYLQTGYKVNGVYVASSTVVTVNVQSPPTLTLGISISPPTQGVLYALSGYLRDSSGNALANKPIDIFYHFEGAGWQFSNTVYTGADGKYSTTTSSMKKVYLQTGYKVGGTYVASSNVLTVTPYTATALTINLGTAGDGSKYLYGRLTEKYSGTPIKTTLNVYEPASMSPWVSLLGTAVTNDNGDYTFSRFIHEGGKYLVEYPGDATRVGTSAGYNW